MHAPSSEFLHDKAKEGVKSVVKLLALNRGLSGPTLRSQAPRIPRVPSISPPICIPPPRPSPPRVRVRLRILKIYSCPARA